MAVRVLRRTRQRPIRLAPAAVFFGMNLPDNLVRRGLCTSRGEVAWDPVDAAGAAHWLRRTGQAITGGSAVGRLSDGSLNDSLTLRSRRSGLTTGWDVRGQQTGESWDGYCDFCLTSALASLRHPLTAPDVSEDVDTILYTLTWRGSEVVPHSQPLVGNPDSLYWG